MSGGTRDGMMEEMEGEGMGGSKKKEEDWEIAEK